ncbi:hypothetical protein LTR53_011615 [Teratosphaeriaceae sp. CCFEE 6253]|nr:hypothetical protein LTR53_011615 [Teratosphaeriaceae sp. CCFEE 6253]
MSRLSLSDTDKQARDWFHETTTALGCKVHVDAMGNQFAIRPGLSNDAPPTYAGSHLDTQPTGGRYDGILGVTAAVEMLRVLNDNWVETAYPVGVVNWTNEAPRSMTASGVWAGDIPLEKAHSLRSVIPANDTVTMRSELERIGYLGDVPCSAAATPMAAHFELHIEQGPILEAENRRVGVVQGVQSYKWFTVTHRADALLASSMMIVASHKIATQHGALASTGIIEARPGSTNTVPGFVQFSLDIRAPENETVNKTEEACRSAFSALAAGDDVLDIQTGCAPSSRHCSVEWRTDFVSPATKFNEDCIACVQAAGQGLCGGGEVKGRDIGAWGKLMTSGAGHDSVYASWHCPASMMAHHHSRTPSSSSQHLQTRPNTPPRYLTRKPARHTGKLTIATSFVPCRDGVSHNPAEYSTPEQCADGGNVLLGAVVRYDKLRGERGRESGP